MLYCSVRGILFKKGTPFWQIIPISYLGNGLHAQNKHDLCRTINIQNDIDKLNTFQLTQFHLWWCQVCRAWEFKEYNFLKEISDDIAKKATKIYEKQIKKNKVLPYHCDYRKLEHALSEYKKEEK